MSHSTCTIDGCEKPAVARGWCSMHWARWKRHGDPLVAYKHVTGICEVCGSKFTAQTARKKHCSEACTAAKWRANHVGKHVEKRVPTDGLREARIAPEIVIKHCIEDGCVKPVKARGYCSTHHQYRYTHGTLQSRFCRGCGVALPEGADIGQRYCTKECRPVGVVYPKYWKPCQRCGLPIDMGVKGPSGRRKRSDVKTCDFCRKSYYRRHKTSLSDVIRRDGTTCGICGDEVSLALAAPNPASPSVDHIIPYSLGGTHDLDNLQLAHLGCSQQKNNKAA